MSRRPIRLGLVLIAAVVASLAGVSVAIALTDSGPGQSRPETVADVDNPIGNEIYGQDRISVMGPNGIAGWVYPADLNHNTSAEDFENVDALNEKLRNWAAPVHDSSGAVIGYWVTNGLGFVDLETYNSPSYNPDRLRQERVLAQR